LWLLYIFLSASNFKNLNNSWAYNLEYTKEFECEDGRNVNNKIAWPLFFIVVLIFLSTDLYDSLMMFRQGILQRNFRKVIAGFILLFISVLSFVTSFLYNIAAMTTSDILIDAAVIFFLSHLDECIHQLITHMAPDWEEDIEKSICPEDNNDIGESVNDGVVKISEFNKLKREFKEMKQQVDVLTATLKSQLLAMQKELNMGGNETLGEEEKVEIERESSVMQNIDHVRKDDDASIDSTSSADNISSSNDSDNNIKLKKKKSRCFRKYNKRRKS